VDYCVSKDFGRLRGIQSSDGFKVWSIIGLKATLRL
jgi:hypothetical protein